MDLRRPAKNRVSGPRQDAGLSPIRECRAAPPGTGELCPLTVSNWFWTYDGRAPPPICGSVVKLVPFDDRAVLEVISSRVSVEAALGDRLIP
jgi:hypothetical protein